MKHAASGVIVGYLVWTALWLGGNALLFNRPAEIIKAGQRYGEAGSLGGIIALSVVCSLAAGLVGARLSRERARGAVLVLAVLLLATGIFVQSGVWSLMPVWYHLTFLALVVPVTVMGGRLVGRQS